MFLSLHQMAPLHMAAERGRFELVECLAGKGSMTDIKDKEGVGICDLLLAADYNYLSV